MHESTGQVMKIRTAIFLALSFAAFLWLGHPLLAQKEPGRGEKGLTSRNDQANAFFLKAKEDFAKRDLDRAEDGLKTCLKIQPDRADALFLLAQVNYLKGNFAQALVDIQKAETAHAAAAGDPNVTTAERRKELLAARTEKEQQVVFIEGNLYTDCCKTEFAKQRLPEEIDALRNEISLINAALSQPQVSESAPLPADYSYIHGNILFKMNHLQEAANQYLKAIGTDPRHLPAYNNLVNLCYVTGDFEKALKFIEQGEANGVELNPKLKEAVTQIAKK